MQRILFKILIVFICFNTYEVCTKEKERFSFVNRKVFIPLLQEEIDKYDFKFPDIIIAQAQLESGFKSTILKEQNNLFGMRHPRKRKTLSKGSSRGYARFDTWQDSVEDRYLYELDMFRGVKTRAEYIDKLKNYSKSSAYIEVLLKIAKQYD